MLLEVVIEKALALDAYFFFVLSGVFGQTGDFILTRRIPSSNQAFMRLRRAIMERFCSYHIANWKQLLGLKLTYLPYFTMF